ncbi:MAG TPA: hypothetical protein PLO50_15455, partial [Nitrospira sp.]|nr:hypothetical protein [Nitrospira sp.]
SQGESEKKSDTKNVINGATAGVNLQNNLVSALFGGGSAANPTGSIPQDRTGNGYGGVNSDSNFGVSRIPTSLFLNNSNALLTFTRKDPIIGDLALGGFEPLEPIVSDFLVEKELMLIGGTPNASHGGALPTEKLIIRGLAEGGVDGQISSLSNVAFQPTDRQPAEIENPSEQIIAANNTFLVDSDKSFSRPGRVTIEDQGNTVEDGGLVGGTLGQYSGDPDKRGVAFIPAFIGSATLTSLVEGAITATADPNDPSRRTVTLKGGVALDQGTIATIGTTAATDTYFKSLTTNLGRTFSGSLLSMIKGSNSTTTVLTMQDRMLGVYDGSIVKTEEGNKALLSVLDAKLTGPGSSIPLIDIAAGSHSTLGKEVASDGKRTVTKTSGSSPTVTVTSALVTRSTIPLDGALLDASAPLFALTKATMTTSNHFADLAGNQTQSLKLGDALVALDASKLIINSGHLLNLNNATAAITGYLFSLNNGSTLEINSGSLFSLNDRSSLTLTGNAFGVFGDQASKLTITNNLCSTGPCGDLVNTAGQDIKLNGATIRVAGVGQDVVLPNNFNVFAGNNAAKV